METTILSAAELKSPAVYPSCLIFNLNHRLLVNCLEGITEEQATTRISESSNSLIWMATHIVWARFNTIKLLGGNPDNPYNGLFEKFKPFDPADTYPTLSAVKAEWDKATELLKKALQHVTEGHLATPPPFTPPTGDNSIGGAIIFLSQHESFHIGQMAFLKKYFTKSSMSYK